MIPYRFFSTYHGLEVISEASGNPDFPDITIEGVVIKDKDLFHEHLALVEVLHPEKLLLPDPEQEDLIAFLRLESESFLEQAADDATAEWVSLQREQQEARQLRRASSATPNDGD